MRNLILITLFCWGGMTTWTQGSGETNKGRVGYEQPYHSEEDSDKHVSELLRQAKEERKEVLVQIGGNWCIWCLRFNHLVTTSLESESILDEKYVFYHLNFSPGDKNEKAFAKYGSLGAQLGYSAFLILNAKGEVPFTQKNEDLESGKGYDTKKVKKFL